MQDRVQKSKEEVQKGKDKYNVALKEITEYNPKYMEDMTVVFEKCQENEAQRLQFFKEILFSLHKHLNISQDPTWVSSAVESSQVLIFEFLRRLPQIYEEFYHTINNADQGKDLKWWSNNHGINMAMNWPQFEVAPEFTAEELHAHYVKIFENKKSNKENKPSALKADKKLIKKEEADKKVKEKADSKEKAKAEKKEKKDKKDKKADK